MNNLVDTMEGFFDNIGGKELIFLKDLKDTLDNWKTSSDKKFPINQLDRLCNKAQKENLDFDICIENNLNLRRKYGSLRQRLAWYKHFLRVLKGPTPFRYLTLSPKFI